MSDLSDFIASERAQGFYDSEGSFTIDLDRASILKRRYTLRRPELWVLKFLQSLTRFGAESLEIECSGLEMKLRASFPKAVFENCALSQIFSLGDDNEDPRLPLAEGLRGALHVSSFVELAWWQGANPIALRLHKDSADMIVPPKNLTNNQLSLSIHRGGMQAGLKSIFGYNSFSLECREVERSVVTLAYRVVMNGNTLEPIASLAMNYGLRFDIRCQETHHGPRFRLTKGHELAAFQSVVPSELLSPGSEYSYFLALSASHAQWQVPTVTWVLDGVPVQTEEMAISPHFVGLRLYLPGDGLTTDYSGLSIRQDPEKAERLQKIGYEALRDIASCLPLGLIAVLATPPNRRLLIRSVPDHVGRLLDACALFIGAYGGQQSTVLGSLGKAVNRSHERLTAELADPERWQELGVAELQDLAERIRH